MWQQIREWLRDPVLWLYESAAVIALVSRQYVLAVVCGVIIPAIGIIAGWFKNQRKEQREGDVEKLRAAGLLASPGLWRRLKERIFKK